MIYIKTHNGKVHIKAGGMTMCRSRLRHGFEVMKDYSGKVCQNCLDRLKGTGFGREAKK